VVIADDRRVLDLQHVEQGREILGQRALVVA
jgi:hypothetical protein